uniref:Endonuclease/exonuclease/phosphatase domain-containing protein n=1 Tax=Arundo donax TaxID=35708 RepID=A0A0A9F2E3_ARUDO
MKITNAYGTAQDDHKQEFLAELANVCSHVTGPYILAGDFNIIRYSFEKNKGGSLSHFSHIFNSVTHNHELRELTMSGGLYTWSNNQENPTLEKLDRIFVNKEWEHMFPLINVQKFTRDISNHNLLLMSTDNI